MLTLVKAAIAGVLSLGATSAFAAIGDPWSNTSDLILVVENATTHAAYALDTGISLNTLLPTGSLQTGAVLEGIASDLTGYTAASGVRALVLPRADDPDTAGETTFSLLKPRDRPQGGGHRRGALRYESRAYDFSRVGCLTFVSHHQKHLFGVSLIHEPLTPVSNLETQIALR